MFEPSLQRALSQRPSLHATANIVSTTRWARLTGMGREKGKGPGVPSMTLSELCSSLGEGPERSMVAPSSGGKLILVIRNPY